MQMDGHGRSNMPSQFLIIMPIAAYLSTAKKYLLYELGHSISYKIGFAPTED